MKKRIAPLSQREVPELVRTKARPPLVVVMGSPAEVVHLLDGCDGAEAVCYQMDLHQAERLRAELAQRHPAARVATAADLWDLPADFQTALYLPPRGGERELKIDMVEQAFHVLRPHGTLVVWSPYETDPFFAGLLKKVFGRAHAHNLGTDTVFWCQRDGERPRRRHEVVFQARVAPLTLPSPPVGGEGRVRGGGPSCRFVSRPGIFSYGRFDNGARALAETMTVRPGDRVLDVGCGCGTNGVFAAQLAGPTGHVAFVDSNVRAAALAEHNARANGVASFEVAASSRVEGPAEGSFDVALANPPYYASSAIARLFIERSRALLKRDGRFYLVTKQPGEVAEAMADFFGEVHALQRRGYTILCNAEAAPIIEPE